jgi:hypothetical protein
MYYYRDLIREAELIVSGIKHNPDGVNLEEIRSFVRVVQQELSVMYSLRRPESFRLDNLPDGMVRITIVMEADADASEDIVRNLWLERDVVIPDDEMPGELPIPPSPAEPLAGLPPSP